jgi:hypothetical protein
MISSGPISRNTMPRKTASLSRSLRVRAIGKTSIYLDNSAAR